MRKRAAWALALLSLAALVAWWLARGRGTPAEPAASPATHEPARAATPAEPGLAPTAAAPQTPDPLRASPALPERPLFPPNSQPLTEGSDPATAPAEDQPVDPASGLHVVFGPRRDVVHPPDPIVIDVQLLDRNGHRVSLHDGRVYFRSERETAREGTGPHAALVDDGNRLYSARFAPTGKDQADLLQFRVFAEVVFEAPGIGTRRYASWVQYTPKPGAELDGRFADRVEGGSLYVDVGLDVARRGHYKVIASLFATDGETAICFSQAARELEAGKQTVPLEMFGKILHDRGLDGPYVVRYLMVFEEFPDRGMYWPGVTVDRAYTTRPYRAAELSGEAYAPPASDTPEVTAQSPSQQGKPPPLFQR